MNDLLFTLVSCAFFMGLVAYISYRKTKGEVASKDGYFLAGRSLSGVFIAGSLLLTNLSAEQLIALNGSAYGYNMTSMAWEVTAGLAIVIMALYLLPRYLKSGFTTLPEFLNQRFDDRVRRLTVILFMLGYGLITGPAVLYSGAVAVLQLFDVPTIFNISYSAALILTVVVIGVTGSLYAIFGGLKAVAVSDTINGVGLLMIGVLVPILGFVALGNGNFLQGVDQLVTTHTEKLNAIGTSEDPIPFGTIFTGMIFANLFYWGTNQYVIQRTLGASSLAEGQKGVLYSGFLKLLVPFLMMIPGIIAFHLYGGGLQPIDVAYPRLVNDVLPRYLSGFFLAVLLGAVFSSFNSLLNSAATMFVLDIYQPLKGRVMKDDELVRQAKVASVVMAVMSFVIAPMLQYAPKGLWELIRVFTGFYNIPVVAVVAVGLTTKRVPPLAASIAIAFHVLVYAFYQFFSTWEIHYVHMYAVLFVVEVLIMLIVGQVLPLTSPEPLRVHRIVDLTPWNHARVVSGVLISCIVALYLIFSPLGLVGGMGMSFWLLIALLLVLNVAMIMYAWMKRSSG